PLYTNLFPYTTLFRSEPDCIRPSVYQIASGSNEILCCVGQGLPSIEPARKIGNVAKPGAPQDTGRDRAAVAALAMDDEQFAAIQDRKSTRLNSSHVAI